MMRAMRNLRRTSGSTAPRAALAAAIAIAIATLTTGCLPGDTRPVPGRLEATAEPSEALANGIETADGWTIAFDRFVLAVGNIDFDYDEATCNSYAEAHYDRLFDFTVAAREKVGTAYGLGACSVDFRLRSPSFDALLGPGVTPADVAFMRIRGTDRFAEDRDVSVMAIGAGSRGGETKRFTWLFRRSYEIERCAREDGSYATTIDLEGSAVSELRIEVRAEALFSATAADDAELRFQPIADADADADGEVTLDELSLSPRPPEEDGAPAPGDGAPLGAVAASLEGLIYGELLPRILGVVGAGPCESEERSRR